MIHNKRVWWGVVLIGIGVLFLLDNLGLLAPLHISAGQLIFSLALIGFGVWILWASTHGRSNFVTEELNIPLEADEAHVRIDFGAGELIVKGTTPGGTLLSGTFDGVEHQVTREDTIQRVRLESPLLSFPHWNFGPAYHRRWSMALTLAVPLSLTVKTGACDTKLDLSDLRVTHLKIETGASSTHIITPAHAGYTEIRGSSGAASMDIEIPEGVAARIRTGGALASVSVDRERFPKVEGEYRSPNYETASNKVDIKLEVGVGSFSIH
jgi:hypothetical protein